VGHGSKIGAGSVVIHDVPSLSTVVGNPGHPVRVEGRRPEGPDTDWVHLPDPIADAIKGLATRISALEQGNAADGNSHHAPDGEADITSPSSLGPDPTGG
jgi:serine O-acetyltransferase